MPSATLILTAFAGVVAVLALTVFFFGIPPEFKQKLERGALKAMGENKLSYFTKDQVSKIPEANQQELKELKQRVSGSIGGILKNPLGDHAGEAADNVTKPLSGR